MDRPLAAEFCETVRGRTDMVVMLSTMTTMGVGGPADLVFHPVDREDLTAALTFLKERGIGWLVLGGGSNVVVRDGGVRGVVIDLSENFDSIESEDEPEIFKVEAGTPTTRMARWAGERGISGFEQLCGIPGTVGGALASNAGAWGSSICDGVQSLEMMDDGGEVYVLDREELDFDYRQLTLKPRNVILSAVMKGTPCVPAEAEARMNEYLAQRKESQPVYAKSAGCIFKNPVGKSAGELIDACGLKGVRAGNAEVSKLHANFIVNVGGANSKSVVSLIGMIQERVYVKHKIKLEPEVRIIGSWEQQKLRVRE